MGLLTAMDANAATETVLGSFTLPTASNAAVQNFNVAAFDNSQGTLTGVSISFASGSTATVQASVFVAGQGTGTATSTSISSFILLAGGTSLINTGPISNTFTQSTAVATGIFTNPSGTSVALSALSPYVLSSGLSLFSGAAGAQTTYTVEFLGTGAGALPGSITSAGGLDTGSTGTVFVGGAAAANGAVNVTYTYTSAVPEPSTYALMVAGLGLVGFAVRRRTAA
jgi:hypothetical protein